MTKSKIYAWLIFIVISNEMLSSDNNMSNKGFGYFYWGYNRSFFTNSDIHIKSNQYDFTLKDVEASDRPPFFSIENYFSPKNITVPQYCYRIGYFITDHIHISLGLDHMKYVVNQNQMVRISGHINSSTNSSYNGVYADSFIEIRKGFLEFEHTNGLNLATVQIDYSLNVLSLWRQKLQLKYNFGIGGVWVGTKSDIRILDEGIDNDHHLAGYSLTIQTGTRIELYKLFFLDWQIKVGHMLLSDIFIENYYAPKRADQSFQFISYYGSLGLMLPINKMFKKKSRQ